jgi:hypothetical protein
VIVPNVGCFPDAAASQTIGNAGLIPKFSFSGPDVLQTFPVAGTVVKRGSVVVLKRGTCP